MLGWFKLMQEVTCDLQGAARIILKQNPHCLKWASERFWEFSHLLIHKYNLTPDRSTNGVHGFAWGNDKLLFFDNSYGVDKDDVYHSHRASLCLSLVLVEGKRPVSYFKATLEFNITEPADDEDIICHGSITLESQRGKMWHIAASVRTKDETHYRELHKHFPSVFRLKWLKQDGVIEWYKMGCEGEMTPADVRKLFNKMAKYLLAKQVK